MLKLVQHPLETKAPAFFVFLPLPPFEIAIGHKNTLTMLKGKMYIVNTAGYIFINANPKPQMKCLHFLLLFLLFSISACLPEKL